MSIERIAIPQAVLRQAEPPSLQGEGVEMCRQAFKQSGHGQLATLLNLTEQNDLFSFARECAGTGQTLYHFSGVKVTPIDRPKPLKNANGEETLAGKGFRLAYQALGEEVDFLLSGGSGQENIGGKGNLRPDGNFDADFFMVSKSGKPIDLKAAYRAVAGQEENPDRVRFTRQKSWWIPGWNRLEMDRLCQNKAHPRKESLGHFTRTRFCANLAGAFYLVQHAATWGSATRFDYCFYDEEGKLRAADLDFYPRHRLFKPIPAAILGIYGARKGQDEYLANVDHFPQFTFFPDTEEAFISTFFTACHQIRRAVGGNFVNLYDLTGRSNYDQILSDPAKYASEIQKETWNSAAFIAQNIMYRFAQKPELVVYDLISAYKAVKLLWEVQEACLKANPLWGWRCLQSPEDFGGGIIDPQGPLDELALFLNEGNRRERLEAVLQKQPAGPNGTGYAAYLNFLLSECRGSWRKVSELMIPRKLRPLIDPLDAEDFMKRRLNIQPH